jgi:FkbM family methyltransferase
MRSGSFENSEIAFVRTELAHCDLLVDVGANVGLYTCLARQVGKPVVAVEPDPRNCSLLFTNLIVNGWTDTEVLPVALGQHPGIVHLFGAGTGASLVRGWADAHPLLHRPIAMSTLDRILGDRYLGKRLLIKIDIEGGEYDMLLGSSMTLSHNPAPTWLVEVCLTEHHPDGINPHFADVFRVFWERGYKAYTLDRPPRLIKMEDVNAWSRSGKRAFGSHNTVFRM